MSAIDAYWKSIKSPDTEETLDLYFYRPFGFAIAAIASRLKITPTQLTLIGLATGIFAGALYYENHSASSLALGTMLFILSGIFDSADGQLARLTGQYTQMGLVLDGICDATVFMSIYLFSTLTLVPHWGSTVLLLGAVALICHSFQSAVLDFYNREYLYFGYGKVEEGDYWNPSLEQARRAIRESSKFWERWMNRARYQWLFQQHSVTTRTDAQRKWMQASVLGPHSEIFQDRYRELNRVLLRYWCMMGPNFHTLMIMAFVWMRRFDLYLLLVDIVFLNIVVVCLRQVQKRKDKELFDWMRVNCPSNSPFQS